MRRHSHYFRGPFDHLGAWSEQRLEIRVSCLVRSLEPLESVWKEGLTIGCHHAGSLIQGQLRQGEPPTAAPQSDSVGS